MYRTKIFKKLSFNGISNTTFKIDVRVSTESLDALQHQISAQISRVKSGEGDAISVSGKRSDLSIIGLKIFSSVSCNKIQAFFRHFFVDQALRVFIYKNVSIKNLWWGRSCWIHVMSPSAAFFKWRSSASVGNFDANVIFSLGQKDPNRRALDWTVIFNRRSHRVFEEFETNVMEMGRDVTHFDVFSVWKK